jgi:hypothetical protein
MAHCASHMRLCYDDAWRVFSPTKYAPTASRFESIPEVSCLAAATLLRSTEAAIKMPMLHRLEKARAIRSDPQTLALCCRTIGNEEYTFHNMKIAIAQNMKTLRIHESQAIAAYGLVADDLVWLGHIYLWSALISLVSGPKALVRAPRSIAKGLSFLKRGRRIALAAGAQSVVALSLYYKVDALQSWASLFMLIGHRACRILVPMFSLIERRYRQLQNDYSEYLGEEYHRLRWLESAILCGRKLSIDREIAWIDSLDYSYSRTENDPQTGNPPAYEALLRYSQGERGRAIKDLLRRADDRWQSSTASIETGIARLILFRRYMGLIRLPRAVRLILRRRWKAI